MTVISILLLLALIMLQVESDIHFRSIKKIRNRILVNGTRGKSTLVEYLAIALEGSGSAMAKITGVVPTLIYNNQRAVIQRRGGVRIQEQFGIIREAARKGCDSLILECMSIQPELQKTESRFFKPQIYIITNTREDHREIESGTGIPYARSVIQAIPRNCTVITVRGEYSEEIIQTAEKRNSEVIFAEATLPDQYSGTLPDSVFPENFSIAFKACELLNIDVEDAMNRILSREAEKSPRHVILDQDRRITFLKGFDINDTDSAEINLNKWLKNNPGVKHIIPLLNTRSDRPLRTKLFCSWMTGIHGLDRIIITGDHRNYAERSLLKAGFDRSRLIKSPDMNREKLLALSRAHTLIVGLGNIAGAGSKIAETLK